MRETIYAPVRHGAGSGLRALLFTVWLIGTAVWTAWITLLFNTYNKPGEPLHFVWGAAAIPSLIGAGVLALLYFVIRAFRRH